MKCNIAAQPVELGDAYGSLGALRCLERCRQLRPPVERVSALPRLDFGVLAGDLQALGLGEGLDGSALRLQAETRTPLLSGGYAVVGDDRGQDPGSFSRRIRRQEINLWNCPGRASQEPQPLQSFSRPLFA